MRQRRLSPAQIQFTQDSVAMCFQNDEELNATCEKIAKGDLRADSLRTIRVRLINGVYNKLANELCVASGQFQIRLHYIFIKTE